MTRSIKTEPDGSLLLLAAPNSGPFPGGKDADGETFTTATNYCLDWPPQQRALLYDHGLDPGIGVEPIGVVELGGAKRDEAGLWLRAQLSKSSRYHALLRRLLAQAEPVLFASSGAYSHLVERGKGGEILRWPLVEVSLTPTPSNIYATVTPQQVKAFKAAGVPGLPDLGDAGDAPAPAPDLAAMRDRLALYQIKLDLAERRRRLERTV